MPVAYSPRQHSDRQQICRMLDEWQVINTDALRASLFETHFKAPMTAYRTLFNDYAQKKTEEKNALLAVKEVEEQNDAAARNWASTVRDNQGRERSAEIRALLMGTLLSVVLRKNTSFKLKTLGTLFDQLEIRRDLRGDELQLATFRQKFDAFKLAVSQEERVKNQLTAIGVQYTDATSQFNKAYTKFRKLWLLNFGEEDHNAFFPEFVSNKKDEKKDEKKAEKKALATAKAEFAAAQAEKKAQLKAEKAAKAESDQ